MMPELLAVEKVEVMAILVEEILEEQVDDLFWKQSAETAEQPEWQYDQERYGLLVQTSALDAMLRRGVPKRLRVRVLHLAHYRRLAG